MTKITIGVLIGAVVMWLLLRRSRSNTVVNRQQIEEKQKIWKRLWTSPGRKEKLRTMTCSTT